MILGLTMFGPLLGFGRLFSEFDSIEKSAPQLLTSPLWNQYKIASWSIFCVTASIGIFAGLFLYKFHRPSTVIIAVTSLWLVGPIGNFIHLVAANLIFGDKVVALGLPEMLGGITASIITSAIWTAYLLRSQRVKNTYKANVLALSDAGG